jgi:outer membrane protein OmpA-like peptidoglycan-associated protein
MIRAKACAALLWGIVACTAFAQQPARVLLGPDGGFSRSTESSSLPIYESPDCGEFTGGSASVSSLGASLILRSFFSDRLSLAIGAGLSYSSRRLTGLPIDPVPIFDSVELQRVELDRRFYLDSRTLGAYLDLMAQYEMTDRFAIGLGPSLGWQILARYEQSDNVLGPGDYTFPDGQRRHPMYDSTPRFTANPFLLGSTLKLSYSFPFARHALLVPELSLHADFLSLVREASWRSYAIGGKVSLLFDATPAPAPIDTPVIAALPEGQGNVPRGDATPARPKLIARMRLAGIDENGDSVGVSTVRVSEVFVQQHAPLVPALFFDRGSAEVPDRYVLTARAMADSFSLGGLAGLDVFEIQHHLLDIIGYRLRADGDASVTLAGSASKDEAVSIAGPRADRVRAYLQSVWGIDNSRIIVDAAHGAMPRSSETGEDGRGDNRRTEISSNRPGLLAPVVTQQVVRNFDPPLVRLSPWYQADAGLKRWDLTITQKGKLVARYSSVDSGIGDDPDLMWRIDHETVDSMLAPLVAELVVEDSTGARDTSRSELPMVLARKLTVVNGEVQHDGNSEQITYNLVAFNYNVAELGEQNEAQIASIAASIKEGARVTITGYTDRIGEERHNVQLSTQRAERVAAALRAQIRARGLEGIQLITTGAGIETARFANDVPEGRVLSRGVSVIVEQTISER